MAEQAGTLVDGPLGVRARALSAWLIGAWRWEFAVAFFSLVAAVAVFWVTLDAHFLAYPGPLAVQKADQILGPVGAGLYWRHRRPASRLGLLLIALGLVTVPYIFESTTPAALFGIGLLSEFAIFLMTEVVILAFPSGRLPGVAERLILGAALLVVLAGVVQMLTQPELSAGGSISGCRAACPRNGLAIWSPPSWTPQLEEFIGWAICTIALSTAVLLVWRFVRATPPRRRALAIGTPVALMFLLAQASWWLHYQLSPNGALANAKLLHSGLQWSLAGARAAIWYGFVLALIAAQLYAGRVLSRLVADSLGRPSFRELEGMLRRPLGDPGLRLGFWQAHSSGWADADGARLEPPAPGQALTEVKRDGRPAAAIVHDEQLAQDPELLRAAGAVVLLALENAELDAAWKNSLRQLGESRARIVTASENERRKLERDLHDGAQQRLLGALLRLSAAYEVAPDDPKLRRNLNALGAELEGAINELRDLAHGIYPAVLADMGLAAALHGLATHSAGAVTVTEATNRRFGPEIEAALYYCCLEAIQNASKHAGPAARISIRLSASRQRIHLEVRDNGLGFDTGTVHDGVGLQNMRDRVGAVGGGVEINSAPGRGTLVSAQAPLTNDRSSSPAG